MITIIKRFVGRVRIVQRGFRRMMRMRQARVEALLVFFLQDGLIDDDQKLFIQMHAGAQDFPSSHKRRASSKITRKTIAMPAVQEVPPSDPPAPAKTASVKPQPTGAKRHSPPSLPGSQPTAERTTTRASVMQPTAERTECMDPSISHLPPYVRDYRGTDEPIPLAVRKVVLLDHVTEMQMSLAHRLAQWKANERERQIALDLVNMGFTADAEEADADAEQEHRPRCIELHRLKDLYSNTYDAWQRGAYKSMLFDMERRTKKAFSVWRKVTQNKGSTAARTSVIEDETTKHYNASQTRSHNEERKIKKMGTMHKDLTAALGSIA